MFTITSLFVLRLVVKRLQIFSNLVARSSGVNKMSMIPSPVNFHSITPNEYKKMKDFQITYGVSQTKFGNCMIGLNGGNLCFLGFYDDNEDSALNELNTHWPRAVLSRKNDAITKIKADIFDNPAPLKEFDVLVKGTDLQVNVWKQLVNIKKGTTTHYEQVAQAVGNPKAVRAVANAIAKNKIAYVIPCHRVIRKQGNINKYRWGPTRREMILKHEIGL